MWKLNEFYHSSYKNSITVYELVQASSKMESIITNPGLQHLAENIFWNLGFEDLKICRLINQSCLQILENPMFWLRKFVGLKGKPKRLDQSYSIGKEFWEEKGYHFLSAMEFKEIWETQSCCSQKSCQKTTVLPLQWTNLCCRSQNSWT